jgi:hypothetical protein
LRRTDDRVEVKRRRRKEKEKKKEGEGRRGGDKNTYSVKTWGTS